MSEVKAGIQPSGTRAEIEQLRQQLKVDQDMMQRCYEEIEELTKENESLEERLEHVNGLLNDRDAELARLATSQHSDTTSDQVQNLLELNQLKADTISQLMKDNENISKEVEMWFAKCTTQEQQLDSLQEQMNELHEHYEKADAERQESLKQLQEEQQQTLTAQAAQIKDLEDQLLDAAARQDQLQDQVKRANFELAAMETSYDEATAQIDKMHLVIEDQAAKIAGLESQFRSFEIAQQLQRTQQHHIAVLTDEVERLNMALKSSQVEMDVWRNKHSRLELSLMEYRQFEMTNRDTASRAYQLAEEVEKLRDQVKSKSIEIMQLRNHLKDLSGQVMDLQEQLNELQETNTGQFNTIVELRNKAVSDHQAYLLMTAENDRLQGLLVGVQENTKHLSAQFEDMGAKYNEMCEKSEQLILQLEEQERQLETLKQHNEEEELQQLRNLVEQYEDQLQKLKNEIRVATKGEIAQEPTKDQIGQEPTKDQIGQEPTKGELEVVSDPELIDGNSEGDEPANQMFHNPTHDTLQEQLQQRDDETAQLRRQIQDLLCLIAVMMAEMESQRNQVEWYREIRRTASPLLRRNAK